MVHQHGELERALGHVGAAERPGSAFHVQFAASGSVGAEAYGNGAVVTDIRSLEFYTIVNMLARRIGRAGNHNAAIDDAERSYEEILSRCRLRGFRRRYILAAPFTRLGCRAR